MTQQARDEASRISTDLLQRCSAGTIKNRELVEDVIGYINSWIEDKAEDEREAKAFAKSLCIFCKQPTLELNDYQIVLSRDALTSYIACVHPPCLEPFLAHQKVEESNHD